MGEHDARFIDTLSDVAEKVADSISHKLRPMVEQYAKLFKTGICTPVLKRPSDIGLDYEDVFFPSLDGMPLEAWFIPADSDKLLIVNHPMTRVAKLPHRTGLDRNVNRVAKRLFLAERRNATTKQ